MSKHIFSALILVLLFCGPTVAKQNVGAVEISSKKSKGFNQFRSLFESVYLNCEAIRNGDVLVEETMLLESCLLNEGIAPEPEPPKILSRTVRARSRFDFDKKFYAKYYVKRDLLDISDESPDEIRVDVNGFIANSKYVVRSSREFEQQEVKVEKLRPEFHKNEFRFLKQIGFIDYRATFWSSGRASSLDSKIKLLASRKNEYFQSLSPNGKGTWRVFEKFKNSGDTVHRYTGFEKETGMICNHSVKYYMQPDGQEVTASQWNLKWEKQGDVFVPVSGSKTVLVEVDLDGKSVLFGGKKDIKLHWFFVNKKGEVESHIADDSINSESIVNMTDPVKNKATRIMDSHK